MQRAYLATAYADKGQFDDARTHIAEAMAAAESAKERWFELEIDRIVGEIELMAPERDVTKAEGHFQRALDIALGAADPLLGASRGHEPRPALAQSGQAAGGP